VSAETSSPACRGAAATCGETGPRRPASPRRAGRAGSGSCWTRLRVWRRSRAPFSSLHTREAHAGRIGLTAAGGQSTGPAPGRRSRCRTGFRCRCRAWGLLKPRYSSTCLARALAQQQPTVCTGRRPRRRAAPRARARTRPAGRAPRWSLAGSESPLLIGRGASFHGTWRSGPCCACRTPRGRLAHSLSHGLSLTHSLSLSRESASHSVTHSLSLSLSLSTW
jgi:hypothetical protein